MCQGYDAEHRAVLSMEADEVRRGHPLGCDFQAGFFQCPNRYNRYAVTYTREYLGKDKYGDRKYGDRFGWECRTCGTFYPEKEPVRESEAR